ncbi:MAG: hypothetical protein HKM95_01465 [Inquilinus sp.]|nr:hypothetical protein [Inquilinus sp.]
MKDVDRIRRGLQEVASAVSLARTKVEAGQLIDIAGLESRVDELCQATLALEREVAQPLKPSLLSLVDDLNRLSEGLKKQHCEVAAELQGSHSHSQAAAAYRKPRE